MYEVTIGIPVFQAVDYIGATMRSALAQTYPSIEFLVIDDCGGDGSMDVIECLRREHQRGQDIRILHNEKNIGVGPSRNRLIDEAQGSFIYFLDSDDQIEPNTIELMMSEAILHHADVVYASYEQIDNVRHSPTKHYVYPYQVIDEPEVLANYAFRHYGHFQASVCNCLMDIKFLKAIKIRFIDAMYWEDMAFTYELVTMVNRAVLMPNITYHYLCRPNSLSNYQDRIQLQKEEILRNVSTIDYLKWKCHQLSGRTYVPYMCYNLEMNSFYIVCHVIKYRERIVPGISDRDLRQIMHMPLPLREILRFRQCLFINLSLWFVVKLPIRLFMSVIKIIGRMKKVL